MPATAITELPNQNATFSRSLDNRTLAQVFDVYMDTFSARPDEVVGALEALGFTFGSPHPTYGLATLDSFDPRQQRDRRDHWIVTLNYKTRLFIPQQTNDREEDPNQPAPEFRDPLNEPEVISWESQLEQVAVQKDVNGTPILNYAKRPYDPPPTDWQAISVLKKQKNVATFSKNDIAAFVNHVNSVSFEGFNTRHCLCMSITAQKRWRQWRSDSASSFQTTPYWVKTAEIHCIDNDDGPGDPDFPNVGPWDLYLLQQDIMQLDSTSGEPTEILGDDDQPVREPQPIDVNGELVPASNRPAGIEFRGHAIKKTADLNLI